MKSTAPWGAWYSIFGTSLMISCTCEGVPSKIDDLGFFPWWRHINSGKIEMIVWSSENKNSNICIQTELCVPSVTTTPTKTQLIQALLTCPHIPHMFNPIKIHQMYTPQSSDGTRKSEKKMEQNCPMFWFKIHLYNSSSHLQGRDSSKHSLPNCRPHQVPPPSGQLVPTLGYKSWAPAGETDHGITRCFIQPATFCWIQVIQGMSSWL